MKINEGLYENMSLLELSDFLNSFSKIDSVNALKKEFSRYAYYQNVTEWNKVVRICESFAVLGWSDMTPVEARRSKFFNGNPYTGFYDKDGHEHYQGAHWSKTKDGYILTPENVFHFQGKNKVIVAEVVPTKAQKETISSQRNWIAKNPIRPHVLMRNAFPELMYIQKSVDELGDYLNTALHSSKYGLELNYLSISVNISSPFAAYEVVPDTVNTANSHIKVPKFRYRRFTRTNGVCTVDYYIPKEFGESSECKQIQNLKEDMMSIVIAIAQKLEKKCRKFDFEALIADLDVALQKWR